MNINHISYILPTHKCFLSDLRDQQELSTSEALIMERIMGLKSVPRDATKTQYDNICHVIFLFLNEYPISPRSIKYIFLAHTAEYIAPFSYHLSEKIINKFQFKNAHCFGSVVNKCATPFHFFAIANTLFQTLSDTDFILIINSDVAFTSIVKTIPGSTIMGDAASLLLLGKNKNHHHFIDIEMDVDGRFCHGVFGTEAEKLLFQSEYTEKLCVVIKKIVDRNHLSLHQIKLILPHNVNISSWKSLAKHMQLPIQKIYLDNVSALGHCFGSDPFINLLCAISKNLLQKNDFYLLVTVGLGATFSAMLFQY